MRRFCPIPETKPTPGPTQTIRILGLADLGFKGVILELPICLKDDAILQKHFLAALKYLVKIYSIFTQKSLQFKVKENQSLKNLLLLSVSLWIPRAACLSPPRYWLAPVNTFKASTIGTTGVRREGISSQVLFTLLFQVLAYCWYSNI